MSRRNHTETVIQDITSRMTALGDDGHKVAEAADMTLADLNNALTLRAEFNVAELVNVGGFFALTPQELFTEAA
jgi:hypothetical protein